MELYQSLTVGYAKRHMPITMTNPSAIPDQCLFRKRFTTCSSSLFCVDAPKEGVPALPQNHLLAKACLYRSFRLSMSALFGILCLFSFQNDCGACHGNQKHAANVHHRGAYAASFGEKGSSILY